MVSIPSQGHLVKHIIVLISTLIITLFLEAYKISITTSSTGIKGVHSTIITKTTQNVTTAKVNTASETATSSNKTRPSTS